MLIETFIILFIVLLGIGLYFKMPPQNASTYLLLLLSIALLQTFCAGIIIFVLERINFLWLVVIVYNRHLFTMGETALIFFMLFLLIDFTTEILRFLMSRSIPRFLSEPRWRIGRAIIISFGQSLLFVGLNSLFLALGFFGVHVVDGTWMRLPPFLFFIYIWCITLVPELLIERIRDHF